MKRHLEEKVAEFRAKKFSPPQRPVACEEEAAKLVHCYWCVRACVRAWVGGVVGGRAGGPGLRLFHPDDVWSRIAIHIHTAIPPDWLPGQHDREKKEAGEGADGPLACRSLVDIYEECARKVVQAIDVTKAPQ